MAIISQETWDNMPDNEKSEFMTLYREKLSNAKDAYERGFIDLSEKIEDKAKDLERYFGKENLQPKPKTPKIWLDILNQTDINDFKIVHPNCDNKLSKKLEATYKIKWLIELGYGGIITDEEWKDSNTLKHIVYCSTNNKLHIQSQYTPYKHFLSFHTQQQAEEFMSYPENVELVKQYNMI